MLHLDAAKNPKQILQVSVDINYKKKNDEGNLVRYALQITTYFNRKQDNNKDVYYLMKLFGHTSQG
ncbi:hypothetical protein bpmyx0001_57720 [Bacillus pseudomycoides DSM 12442]|nr:hypothetical protein bpmyx0001_57720 [Bacillus pseudomycoides DSM 12442]